MQFQILNTEDAEKTIRSPRRGYSFFAKPPGRLRASSLPVARGISLGVAPMKIKNDSSLFSE
jgi:hypothetical protein